MPEKHPEQDRNFNGLAKRFKRNIYDSPKGQIRLAILKRDFAALGSLADMSVLDAGCGQGQFAAWLLAQGADVALMDVSEEMLALAQATISEQSIGARQVSFAQCDLWALDSQYGEQRFDVVCNHAVLEWLEEPLRAVEVLSERVLPGGWLSLLFYNVHGLIYKNLLRANYKKILSGDVKGQRGSLTPINPLDPQRVLGALVSRGFEIVEHSGVRVFHDYILDRDDQAKQPEQMMALELKFSQQEPYRGLGRYVHVLAKRRG